MMSVLIFVPTVLAFLLSLIGFTTLLVGPYSLIAVWVNKKHGTDLPHPSRAFWCFMLVMAAALLATLVTFGALFTLVKLFAG